MTLVILTFLALGQANLLQAETFTLNCTADTIVRTDLTVRRNDNYGMQQYLIVGSGRGGGGGGWGEPDAMRSIIRFDLAGRNKLAQKAMLELTIYSYTDGTASSKHDVHVHRVLENWIEGDGFETNNSSEYPPGSTGTDPAYGVAWTGLGENTDPSANNNQSIPQFDDQSETSALIDRTVHQPGDIIELDITDLYNNWISDGDNYGLMLRDIHDDGVFRGVVFGARESDLYYFAKATPGPRLVVTELFEYIDDADIESFVYSDKWNFYIDRWGRLNHTVHECKEPGATASINFTGTDIALIGELQPWGGDADVYIDNKYQQRISCFSPVAENYQQTLFAASGLGPNPHVLAITVTGNGWIYLDALRYEYRIAETIIRDDIDSAITYAGNWSLKTGSGWENRYQGTTHESSDLGANASWTFHGSAIRIIADKQPWGGQAEVFIDETSYGIISYHADQVDANHQVEVFNASGLQPGSHEIRIQHNGSGWIYFDAWEVY